MKKELFFLLSFLILNEKALCQDKGQDISNLSLDSLLNVKISTASKYEQRTSEAPSAVSVIYSNDIEKFGYKTLNEVLNGIGGFYISYDRNYSYVGVRGFSRPTDYNDRILLLVNNHPMNENIFGASPMGTDLGLSLSSIDRIEVVRGPGSALYGTGAMFAVINIITKSGKNFDRYSLSLGGGSLGRYSGTFNFGKEIANNLDVFVSAK